MARPFMIKQERSPCQGGSSPIGDSDSYRFDPGSVECLNEDYELMDLQPVPEATHKSSTIQRVDSNNGDIDSNRGDVE